MAEDAGDGESGSSPAEPLSLQQQAAHARSTARAPCVLCSKPNSPSSPCDVWHLLNECTHAHIVEHRAAIRRSAAQLLSTLCKQLVEAAKRAAPRDDEDDDDGNDAAGGHQQGNGPPAAVQAAPGAPPEPAAAPVLAVVAPLPSLAAPAAVIKSLTVEWVEKQLREQKGRCYHCENIVNLAHVPGDHLNLSIDRMDNAGSATSARSK